MFSRKLFSTAKQKRRTSDISQSKSPEPATLATIDGQEILAKDLRAHATVTERSYGTLSDPPTQSKSGSPDRAADPQGLTLLYAPIEPPVADIVFVHGLGGSSRLSWSKNKDLGLFWPQEWLPGDQDVQNARVFTFGYNAFFLSSSQTSAMGVTDFAKNLLYDLLYGIDSSGNSLQIGIRSIIFVTHSMGGLVFKKTYLEGSLDHHYKTIIDAIRAVIFLATPHRGSDLAGFLNKVLNSLSSPKQYVAELVKQGPFLNALNEQFRHVAPKLQVFSFYETLQTSIGFSSTMILDQESAKLGYPGEVSRSLNADHHGVCKFESTQDSNYKVILSALKSLMASYSTNESHNSIHDSDILRQYLSISESTYHDLALFLNRRAESTCTWILDRPQIRSWMSSTPASKLIWLHGRPGRGKSVLSSFLVNHLEEDGALVQNFFFRSGDETKRSPSALLRSLAYQIAVQVPAFRQCLRNVADGGYKIKESDWRATWKQLFVGCLFKLEFLPTLYWIIDGLDESASPQHIFEMLADIDTSCIPIRCLVTSRWSPALITAHDRIKSKISSSTISIDNDLTDIRVYTTAKLSYLGWNAAIKRDIMTKILNQSNDNFLWVYLVLEEIKDCHTENNVKERLEELPSGMEDLYMHMEETIRQIRRPADQRLSRELLLWAIFTQRSISIQEISDFLEPEYGKILNISHTIDRLCGHFIVVEGQDTMALLHHSTREYLMTTTTLPYSLEANAAHSELFRACVSAFKTPGLRSKLTPGILKLLKYRATSWPHHLQAIKVTTDSDQHLDILLGLFTQPNILVWIQVVASMGQLKVLVEASHALTGFVHCKRREAAARELTPRRFEDLGLLEAWTYDLLKIPGKFGSVLSQDPSSIFTSIAPFCPSSSAIHRLFAESASSLVSVRGLPHDWDDCLARVSVGSEHLACLIACSFRHLAVVDEVGTVVLWDSTTFQQVHRFSHSERVSAICFNTIGDQIATYGSKTTKVWSSHTGEVILQFYNLSGISALCLNFVHDNKTLLMGSDRRCMLKYDLNDSIENTWTVMDSAILNDNENLPGTYLNSPSSLAISTDGSMIAAAYRRFPLTIWSINPPRILKRVCRKRRHDCPSTPLPFASKLSWHPSGQELLGLFLDGYAFKYNLLDGTLHEQAPDRGRMPADIQCSPDGAIYAIRGVGGTTKLYNYRNSTVIYQLTTGSRISGFSFNYDGRRFFQLHGNQCSVWEPNSLIRLSAADGQAAHSQSSPEESVAQSIITSDSCLDDHARITVVSPAPKGTLIVTGDENGLVELLDSATKSTLEITRTATEMSIEHCSWNADGSHFIYSEINGRMTLVEVLRSDEGWKHRRVKRFKPAIEEGGIQQLVLSPDTQMALVIFPGSAQFWSLDSLTLHHAKSSDETTIRAVWLTYPKTANQLLCINLDWISVQGWVGNEVCRTWRLSLATLQTRPETIKVVSHSTGGATEEIITEIASENIEEDVQKVISTHFPGHLLIMISRRLRTGTQMLPSRLEVVDTTKLDYTSDESDNKTISIRIPLEVEAEAEIPLNVLPNGQLVFIDRSLRLCTWSLRSASRSAESIVRHFFIPRDWLPDGTSNLLYINPEGTLLCPRRDGLAMIDSSFASGW